jgi:hypothetical protein
MTLDNKRGRRHQEIASRAIKAMRFVESMPERARDENKEAWYDKLKSKALSKDFPDGKQSARLTCCKQTWPTKLTVETKLQSTRCATATWTTLVLG